MKQIFKHIFSFLLISALTLGFSSAVFAEEPSITFKGQSSGFGFEPGSSYTATDLFDNFKNVMPGDKLTETIQIKNTAADCKYIKLYMKAVPHDENNDLTYSESFENQDGNDQSGIAGERDENIASMNDFLSQLTMRIYKVNGTEPAVLIYEASPNTADTLTENIFLGTLQSGDSMELRVELDIPLTLGNEYANRVGEVDWVFTAECFTSTPKPNKTTLTVHKLWKDDGSIRPDSVTVGLLENGKPTGETAELNAGNQWSYTWSDLKRSSSWSAEELNTPSDYTASYKTSGNVVTITNTHEPYEPEEKTTPVSITAVKKWDDQKSKNGKEHPSSASITLYNGDTAVETVLLGDWNNWTYTWTELDGNGDWSVIEVGIPKGYTPSYHMEGNIVTITNASSLIQTGQLNWPIPVLSCLGAILIALGILSIRKSKRT